VSTHTGPVHCTPLALAALALHPLVPAPVRAPHMPFRSSTVALSLLAAACAAFALTFVDARRLAHAGAQRQAVAADLAQGLGLSDIVLFTEARYTRHWSQADLHSAFQDHPLSLEHFPSGSLLPPPRHEALDRTATLAD